MDAPLKHEFNRYLDAIQPTRAQRDLAKDELSFLETRLSEYIQEDDPFIFVKALRSGSFAKATALRRSESADFDADMAVYVQVDDATSTDVANLIAYTEKLARRAYKQRTKRRPRFETNESCVRIVFSVTPKINIDVVPIIAVEHASIPNWGVLPKRDGTRCYTSVSEHVEFVKSRNNREHGVPFRKLVRLVKVWRNDAFSGDLQAKVTSFCLELVLGKAYDECRRMLVGEALPDLSTLIAWIIRHGLTTPICFYDLRVAPARTPHRGPVVVLDPVNRDDNVTASWTVSDRSAFLDALDEFRDLLRDAEIEVTDDIDRAVSFVDQALPKFRDFSEAR